MSNSKSLKNAPSKTGNPSGGKRGNNPPRTGSGNTGNSDSKGKK